MFGIFVRLIENIIYKFIPTLPYFLRTPLYRKFLLFRKLRDFIVLSQGEITYKERIEYAETARGNEHLIGGLQEFNPNVTLTEVHTESLEIFKFEPKNKIEGKVGIYFHGGGYFYCSITSHRNFISNLSNDLQMTIYFFHYRLSPEYNFPAAHEDAKKVLEHIESLHPSENKIWMGESAGGNLLAGVCIDDTFAIKPSALIMLSPWLDLSDKMIDRSYLKNKDILLALDGMTDVGAYYANNHDPTDPIVSPLFGDVSSFPPVFIQVASNELLFNDAVEFVKKLEVQNIENELDVWDNLWHAWHFFPIKEAKEARKRIHRFISKLELVSK